MNTSTSKIRTLREIDSMNCEECNPKPSSSKFRILLGGAVVMIILLTLAFTALAGVIGVYIFLLEIFGISPIWTTLILLGVIVSTVLLLTVLDWACKPFGDWLTASPHHEKPSKYRYLTEGYQPQNADVPLPKKVPNLTSGVKPPRNYD